MFNFEAVLHLFSVSVIFSALLAVLPVCLRFRRLQLAFWLSQFRFFLQPRIFRRLFFLAMYFWPRSFGLPFPVSGARFTLLSTAPWSD